jgi:hypothetical protein
MEVVCGQDLYVGEGGPEQAFCPGSIEYPTETRQVYVKDEYTAARRVIYRGLWI